MIQPKQVHPEYENNSFRLRRLRHRFKKTEQRRHDPA